MKKKVLIAALAGVAVATSFSLTSCKTTVDGAGEDLKVVSLDELKKEETTIEFWHSFGDSVSKALNLLLEGDEEEGIQGFDDWCAEQGYKIKVNVTNKGGGYDGLRKAVNMGAKSKAVPTLLLGYPDHFADYIANKILLPLDEYVNAEDENIALEGGAADFIDTYWKENQMDVNGDGNKNIAGIPFNKSTEIMCYNSNLVDPILKAKGYGTVDASGNVTWTNPTWEEVLDVSKYIVENKTTLKYTYKGAEYDISPDMKYPTYIDSESNFFISTSRQWGGEGAYTLEDGTVTAYNSSTREAMEYFKAAANKGYIELPKAGGTGSYGSSYMQVRKAFISIGSTAGVKNNAASLAYEMKATIAPQKSYDESANQAVIQQGTNLAILSANSNNKTRLAAWLLIKFLTNTKNQTIFSTNSGYIPVRKSSQESEEFAELLAAADPSNFNYAFNGAVAKGLTAAFEEQKYFYTDPAFNGSSVVRDEIGVAVEDMFLFNKSYDEAMTAFYTKMADFGIETKKTA